MGVTMALDSAGDGSCGGFSSGCAMMGNEIVLTQKVIKR